MKITYRCEWCGETVTKVRSPATMKVPPRFCSQKCNGNAQRGTGNGPTATHELYCASCGTHCKVYRSPSAPEPTTCSLKCTGIMQRAAGNASYAGGRHVASNGYVLVLAPDNPGADVRGYVYEHRLVMERKISRPLTRTEVVHHVNHVKTDNSQDNLMLFATHSDHIKYHAQEAQNVSA